MNKNNIIITVVSLVIVFGFLLLVYYASGAQNGTTQTNSNVYEQAKKITDTDHVKWNKDATVILTEYSDFQCPACGQFYTTMAAWTDSTSPYNDITKNVKLVYRHYPLQTIHPYALPAARAAEAASMQGKFFEYHDVLFEEQSYWSDGQNLSEKFVEFAKQLKLDTDQFEKDIDSSVVSDRVTADITTGNELTINATPTFFLNGRKMQFNSIDDFANQIRDEVKSTQK